MKNPYDILRVPRDAGAQAIRKAYRALARDCHPDSDPGNPWAEDEFKELAAAYGLLSDAAKRAAFDRGEIDAKGNPRRRARAGAGQRFEDLVRRRKKRGVKVRGADVSYAVNVTFIEAARGITKRITTSNEKRLDVRVPPGTTDGQVLRLKGQGTEGVGGAVAGDALVEVEVKAHPRFTLQGDDIHIEVPVTVHEAVSGVRIEVPTIDGPVSVTVPAGSNTGSALRLKGRGIERPAGSRGTQLVTLKVVLPGKQDAAFTEFVERWGPQNPYTVRRGGD